MARPSIITAEQINAVIARMEAGDSENAACKNVGIGRSTFRSAALRHGVSDNYARALEALASDQVEKLEKAIDDMRDGTIDHQIARVEIDARKWFASKFLPTRYGDKIEVEHSGSIDIDPDARAARIAELTAKLHGPE